MYIENDVCEQNPVLFMKQFKIKKYVYLYSYPRTVK